MIRSRMVIYCLQFCGWDIFMLKITPYGKVTRLDIARSLAGKGRYWTTAYLVDGLLVDSGCAHCAHELVRALEGQAIACIVNTHSHEDHIGANGLLQRRQPDLDIYAHPTALPVLADPRHKQLHPYRRLFWGWPEPSQARPLADGEYLQAEHLSFQVLYTPGHSPDHICLYQAEQGWLFTGDLFVGGQERALRAEYDIWQIIASLKRIAALPAEWMFPGSARTRQDVAGELGRKIAYLEELGERLLELDRQGLSVAEIARRLLGSPIWIEWVTLGHFSRRRLVLSYLGRN